MVLFLSWLLSVANSVCHLRLGCIHFFKLDTIITCEAPSSLSQCICCASLFKYYMAQLSVLLDYSHSQEAPIAEPYKIILAWRTVDFCFWYLLLTTWETLLKVPLHHVFLNFSINGIIKFGCLIWYCFCLLISHMLDDWLEKGVQLISVVNFFHYRYLVYCSDCRHLNIGCRVSAVKGPYARLVSWVPSENTILCDFKVHHHCGKVASSFIFFLYNSCARFGCCRKPQPNLPPMTWSIQYSVLWAISVQLDKMHVANCARESAELIKFYVCCTTRQII